MLSCEECQIHEGIVATYCHFYLQTNVTDISGTLIPSEILRPIFHSIMYVFQSRIYKVHLLIHFANLLSVFQGIYKFRCYSLTVHSSMSLVLILTLSWYFLFVITHILRKKACVKIPAYFHLVVYYFFYYSKSNVWLMMNIN